jgi:hypothetical protein
LQPLLASTRTKASPVEPLEPEETPRGVALAALKEIDFDRETGKLSDGDYEFLKTKYTRVALEALRSESPGLTPDGIEAMIAAKARTIHSGDSPKPRCATCGPRPEPDAVFCSTCGLRLTPVAAPETIGLPASLRAPA